MRELAERVHRGRKAIALAKQRGIDASDWQQHLDELLATAGARPEPLRDERLEPWMLWEWRRTSIPPWRQVLLESISSGEASREGYARWMLRDVLLDPEYQESK